MPNLIYMNEATAITWLSSGGTNSFMTGSPGALAASAGRQGALYDFDVAARSRLFAWRAWVKPGATRVTSQPVHIYLKTSDGSHPDNDDGTGDIAVSAEAKLNNLVYIGSILIDEDAAVEMAASGVVEISGRYVAPVFWNGTANALSSTESDYGFSLTPVPDEVQ